MFWSDVIWIVATTGTGGITFENSKCSPEWGRY